MQTRGIVAFEIEIIEIQVTEKSSHNRDEKNHQNIISELEKTKHFQSIAVANEMKKCLLKILLKIIIYNLQFIILSYLCTLPSRSFGIGDLNTH